MQSSNSSPNTEIKYSIVVPSYNESESLPQLLHELKDVSDTFGNAYEILFVDDGSTDHSEDIIQLFEKEKNITYLKLQKNVGKASALHAGIAHAKGKLIITIDADLQDDPQEIPKLIEKLKEGYDLVVGWKEERHDPKSKTIPSKLFNYITNKIAHTDIHDHNCGLKIMKAELAKELPLYGDFHRYIPALAALSGYVVGEVAVHHRPRIHGKSKYGIKRMFHGFFDLISVVLITRYAAKPMHLFGYAGLFSFSIGFLLGTYLVYEKFFHGTKIGDRPMLNLATLCMILGVQLVMTGFMGELLGYYQRDPSRYYKIKSIHENSDTKNNQL